MTDISVPILVGTIFLCTVLNLCASPERVGEVDENVVEPHVSLNGYYLDSFNEIASGVGYVYKIIAN